jgi:hypothetical protein
MANIQMDVPLETINLSVSQKPSRHFRSCVRSRRTRVLSHTYRHAMIRFCTRCPSLVESRGFKSSVSIKQPIVQKLWMVHCTNFELPSPELLLPGLHCARGPKNSRCQNVDKKHELCCGPTNIGARDGAVGWGTALQAGRSLMSLEFFIDIILSVALWPWGRLSR